MPDKEEKILDKFRDHLVRTAISEITDKLPEIVKSIMYQQLEQVFKAQKEINKDFSEFRDELKDFDKRLSDMKIVTDGIDSRTEEIKSTQDKQPRKQKEIIESAVQDAVADTVPAAMESVVEPKKHRLQRVPVKPIKERARLFWRFWK